MDQRHIIALVSEGSDLGLLKAAAREFGLQVSAANSPHEAAAAHTNDRVAAALLERPVFGPGVSWSEAVRRLRLALPGVRIVTCHGFREQIDWGELYDLGTFHAIRVPMEETEVRQSLGFIWEAEERTAARKLIEIPQWQTERRLTAGRSYAAG